MLRFEICSSKAMAHWRSADPRNLFSRRRGKSRSLCSHLRGLPIIRCSWRGGGQLIRDKSGEVLGAVGVTGDANELDDICAITDIHTARLCSDSDFFDDPGLMRALSIHKSAPHG